ncbi:MAG TPA: TolC family protein [Polyangiales bacterium]|nr:TolC family protein [Polyangiales bacterium]
MRIAQRDPPAVLVAYAAYRSAQAQRDYADAAWLPAFTAQASGGYTYDERQPLPTLPRVATRAVEVRGELKLEWLAVDVARGERIGSAAASQRARRFDVDATRMRAALLAAELYVRAGAAIELVQDARLSLERRKDQHRATNELVKAGTRSPLDAQRAQVEVLSAEYALELRRTEQRAAFSALSAALGRPPDELVKPATTSADFPVRAESASQAKRLARDHRAELRAAAANVSALRRAYDAAVGQRWPALGLAATGSAAYVDAQSGVAIEGRQFAAAGLGFVRWNGLDPAVWMQAGVSDAAAQLAEREQLERAHEIESEAVGAYYVLERARIEHQRAVAVLEAATVTRDAQNGRYRAGLGSLLELLDAEDLEQQARQARIDAQRDEVIASARLQAACGLLAR